MRYSQNNEQEIILGYFGYFKGRFLDLGANDGQTLSNTRALALNGWSGTLVEASPKAARLARELYKNNDKVQVIEKAIASHTGTVKFYESGKHLSDGDVSLVSTIVPSELDRWRNEQFTELEVPCDTVGNIVQGHYDFVSIDIEGMDYDVLTQLHLTDVKMVCVEYNCIEPQKYIDYCKGFGLNEIHRNGENLIFAK